MGGPAVVPVSKVLWQNREFSRSTFLHADNKLIVLDEDGNLGIAAPTREGLNVKAKAAVLSNKAWTAPTLAGTRLYVRDRAKMMAFELGTLMMSRKLSSVLSAAIATAVVDPFGRQQLAAVEGTAGDRRGGRDDEPAREMVDRRPVRTSRGSSRYPAPARRRSSGTTRSS